MHAVTDIPSWGAVKRFRSIVVSLAMPTQEKHLECGVQRGIGVERVYEALKLLPLGQIGAGNARVCLVDETEVDGSLLASVFLTALEWNEAAYIVKARSVGRGNILEEVSGHRGVVDVAVAKACPGQ